MLPVQNVHKSRISKTIRKSSVGIEQHTSVLLRVSVERVVSGGKGFATTLFLRTEESYRVLAYICLSGVAHPFLSQGSLKFLGNVEFPQLSCPTTSAVKEPKWKLEQSRSCSSLHCCENRCWPSPETQGYLTASHWQGALLAPDFFHAHVLSCLMSGPGLSLKFSLRLIVSNHFSKHCENHPVLAVSIKINQCKIFSFVPKWKLISVNLVLLCSSRVAAFSHSWHFNSRRSSSAFPKNFLKICITRYLHRSLICWKKRSLSPSLTH